MAKLKTILKQSTGKGLKMVTNINIKLVGVLAVAGMALIFSFSSASMGNDDWATNFMFLAIGIVVLFLLFDFLKKKS